MMPEGTLAQANNRAQRRFRTMLAEFFRTGSWDNPATDLYLESDRLVVRLEDAAEWETRKAEIDHALLTDHAFHVHNGYVIAECDDCLSMVDGETPYTFLAGWTESEKREAYGR